MALTGSSPATGVRVPMGYPSNAQKYGQPQPTQKPKPSVAQQVTGGPSGLSMLNQLWNQWTGPKSNAQVQALHERTTVFDPAQGKYVPNPAYLGPPVPGLNVPNKSASGTTTPKPGYTALPTPSANQALLDQVRGAHETMYEPQFRSIEEQVMLEGLMNQARQRDIDLRLGDLGVNNDLQKQRIDLSIGQAQREMGRTNESADSTNWLAGENLARYLQGGQDWINTQGTLTNSLLGDLNIKNLAEARGIEYVNARLALAAQAMGLSRDEYVNAQNMINSRQVNLNTLTNLESEQTQRDYGGQKRARFDDAVASGALTARGVKSDLRDIDEGLRTAQDKLRENLRSGTEELKGQRETARIGYGRAETEYEGQKAGLAEEAASARDRIKLNESEGDRIRTSYQYDTREKERDMQGYRDATQNSITQTNINRTSTLDGLSTNIAQWGIDKQLLDQQMNESARQLGLDKQIQDLEYQQRTGQLNQQQEALLQQMQAQIIAATPLAQQYPWLYKAATSAPSGGAGSNRAQATSRPTGNMMTTNRAV